MCDSGSEYFFYTNETALLMIQRISAQEKWELLQHVLNSIHPKKLSRVIKLFNKVARLSLFESNAHIKFYYTNSKIE